MGNVYSNLPTPSVDRSLVWFGLRLLERSLTTPVSVTEMRQAIWYFVGMQT